MCVTCCRWLRVVSLLSFLGYPLRVPRWLPLSQTGFGVRDFGFQRMLRGQTWRVRHLAWNTPVCDTSTAPCRSPSPSSFWECCLKGINNFFTPLFSRVLVLSPPPGKTCRVPLFNVVRKREGEKNKPRSWHQPKVLPAVLIRDSRLLNYLETSRLGVCSLSWPVCSPVASFNS